MKYALAIFISVIIVTTSALAQSNAPQIRPGDAVRGQTIATTWCSSCHVVARAQGTAVVDVPTFASIAQRLPSDLDVLAAFVANPHPPMPNLSLSRQDIRDVLAYIATLK
jgi:mono/diheme cytochrome c family protein